MLHSMTRCVHFFFSLKAAKFSEQFEFVAGAVEKTAVNENDFDVFVVLRGLYQATYDPLPIRSDSILSL